MPWFNFIIIYLRSVMDKVVVMQVSLQFLLLITVLPYSTFIILC